MLTGFKLPKAGPTFPKEEAEPPTAETKSNPKKHVITSYSIHYTKLYDAGKWWCGFLMLLGRLELFTVLIVLTPYFWKKT